MALTDTAVRAAKSRDKEYKLADGGGLYLLATPSGGRLWRFKFRTFGVEKKLAFGRYPDVSLSDEPGRRTCGLLSGLDYPQIGSQNVNPRIPR